MRQCVVPFCDKNTPRSKDRFCSSHRNEFFIRKISPYKELPPLWAFRKCKYHGWQPFDHFYYQKKCNTYICKPNILAKLKDKYCPTKRKIKRLKEWHRNRNSTLKRHFGINQNDYELLLIKQNNQCAICKKPKTNKNLDIDHCHKTKKVRGLLCRSCNMGLGYFKDSPDFLIQASNYLRHHF